MRIVDCKLSVLSIPFQRQFFSSTVTLKKYDFVLISLETDEGIDGLGYVVTPGYGSSSFYAVIKDELVPLLLGENPFNVELLWEKMWKRTHFFGRKGSPIFGMAALDMALWDIIGKVCGQPLYKILGAYSTDIPVYASGGWLAYSKEELLREMTDYVEEGYTMVKMKIGQKNFQEDYNRLKAVRKAVGDKVKIMVDANQSWSSLEAIQAGKRLEELGIYWLEEPVIADEIEGQAEVTRSLDVAVAAGETEYTRYGFKDLITNKCMDIVQPDYFRVGGITEWRKVAALAEIWHLPISPHSHMEIQAHLMASIANGFALENHTLLRGYMEKVFEGLPEVKDGILKPSEFPGTGFKLLPNVEEKYGK